MIIMGVDTSGSMGGAALLSSKKLLAEYHLNIHNGHSELIIPTIERILTDANLALTDITAFAVVIGPGSFTGLRVGLATIKGFAYSLEKRIVPVTSLEALAWQNRIFPYLICPLIDARRQEVFTQLYRGETALTEATNIRITELIEQLSERSEPILFVGDGAVLYRDQLSKLEQAVFPAVEGDLLRPATVASLGLKLLEAGREQLWYEVLPFYMRKSSAEYQRDSMRLDHENSRS